MPLTPKSSLWDQAEARFRLNPQLQSPLPPPCPVFFNLNWFHLNQSLGTRISTKGSASRAPKGGQGAPATGILGVQPWENPAQDPLSTLRGAGDRRRGFGCPNPEHSQDRSGLAALERWLLNPWNALPDKSAFVYPGPWAMQLTVSSRVGAWGQSDLWVYPGPWAMQLTVSSRVGAWGQSDLWEGGRRWSNQDHPGRHTWSG